MKQLMEIYLKTSHIWKLKNHSKIIERKQFTTFMGHIWFVLW